MQDFATFNDHMSVKKSTTIVLFLFHALTVLAQDRHGEIDSSMQPLQYAHYMPEYT